MATLLPDGARSVSYTALPADGHPHPHTPQAQPSSSSTPVGGTVLLISIGVVGGVLLLVAFVALATGIMRRRRALQMPQGLPDAPTTGTMILRNSFTWRPFWHDGSATASGGSGGGATASGGLDASGQLEQEASRVASAQQASLQTWAVERRLREWAWLQREQHQ